MHCVLPHIDAVGVIGYVFVTRVLNVFAHCSMVEKWLAAVVIVYLTPLILDSVHRAKERKKKYCDAVAEGLE